MNQRNGIGTPDEDYKRGLEAEIKAEQALLSIQGREHKFGIKHQIRGVTRVEHDSEVDKEHVDIIVAAEGNIEVPFQVKPSLRAAIRFRKRFRKYGFGIIQVIVVHAGDTLESIIEQAADMLKIAIAQILRVKNSKIWKYRRRLWKVMGRPPQTSAWKARTKPTFVRTERAQLRACAA